MKNTEKRTLWVVYQMTVHGKRMTGGTAVCEQREWDAMERVHPGHHRLIRAGILNEAEAERLARTYKDDTPASTGPEVKTASD